VSQLKQKKDHQDQVAHSLPFSYDAAVDAESTQGVALPALHKFNFLPKSRSISSFAQASHDSLTWEEDENCILGEWETRRTRHAHEKGASRVASTANSEDEEKTSSSLGQ